MTIQVRATYRSLNAETTKEARVEGVDSFTPDLETVIAGLLRALETMEEEPDLEAKRV